MNTNNTQLSQTPKYFLTYEYLFYFNKFQLLFNFFKKSILYHKLEFLNLAIYAKLNNSIFFKFGKRSRIKKKKSKINFFFLRKKNLYKIPRLNFRILFKIDKVNNKKIRKIFSLNRLILWRVYRKRRRRKKLHKRKLFVKNYKVAVLSKNYFFVNNKLKLNCRIENKLKLVPRYRKNPKSKLRYRKNFLFSTFRNFRKLLKIQTRSFRKYRKFFKSISKRRKQDRRLKLRKVKLNKKPKFFRTIFIFFKTKSTMFYVKTILWKYKRKVKYRPKSRYARPKRFYHKPIKLGFFQHFKKNQNRNSKTHLHRRRSLRFKCKLTYYRHCSFYNFFKFFKLLRRYKFKKKFRNLPRFLKKTKSTNFKKVIMPTNPSYPFKLNFFYGNQILKLKKPFKMRRLFYNVTFLSKHKQPFILYNMGMIMPFKFLYKHRELHVFRIKKKIFSFLKINELKMFVFNTKRRLLLKKIFFLILSKKKFHKFHKLTNKAIYLYFRHNSITNYLDKNSLDFNKVFITEEVFKKTNIHKFKSNFKKKKFKGRELRISRVKFKPGYQRLWRQFRLAFAESINYKYIYQQQLTKYFVSFYRKLNHTYFSQNENTIVKVTIYSKLVPDTAVFKLFMDNNLIFLNNKVIKHSKFFLYKNDFIQLEVSNWHYLYMRFTLNEVHSRQNKFKRLVYRKSLAGRYKLMKQKKQRSNYTPNWIFTTLYDLADVKTNLEVDFFTLSVFILYDTNYLHYTTPKDLFVARHNIYRLYNWKYIN